MDADAPSSHTAGGRKGKKGRKRTQLPGLGPLPESVPSADIPDMILPTSSSIQDILQAAVKLSLTGGDFIDTKFYVFSRRATSGIVREPRAVFANSLSLRKASPHFERLLTGGFAESTSSRLDSSSYAEDQMSLDMYGYESDSDLEDEDDGDDLSDLWEIEPPAQPQKSSEPPPEREQLGNGEEIGNGSSAGDDAPRASITHGVETNGNHTGFTATVKTSHPIPKDLGYAGRTVFVKDMAFKTWQAFIFYTYFGNVEFAPLRSQAGTTRKEKGRWQTDLYQAPQCSPKSMYRLADKYDIKALMELAKKDIKTKLTEGNILVELFSPFTSRYPEILDLEIQFVRENDAIKTKLLASIPQWLERVAIGALPHSGDVLISLFKNLKTTITTEPECPGGCNSGYTRTCSSYNCRRTF